MSLAGLESIVWDQIQADWVDPVTCIVAVVYALWRHACSEPAKKLICRATAWDVFNGVAVFPLVLLTLSVFSKYLTKELMASNKVILFAAGIVALFAVLEDRSGD